MTTIAISSSILKTLKAHQIWQYCDRWWLVLSDAELIMPGELPPTWGLLVPAKNGVLRPKVPAPKLKPKAWDKKFLAAILRKALSCTVPRTVHDELANRFDERVEAEVAKNLQLEESQLERERDAAKRQRDELEHRVGEFEARSGLKIDRGWQGVTHAAKVARLAQALLVHPDMGDIRRLAAKADELATLAREVIGALPDESELMRRSGHGRPPEPWAPPIQGSINPLQCNIACWGGICDLQRDHGGDMHSGVVAGERVWWKLDGTRVDFAAENAAEDARAAAEERRRSDWMCGGSDMLPMDEP